MREAKSRPSFTVSYLELSHCLSAYMSDSSISIRSRMQMGLAYHRFQYTDSSHVTWVHELPLTQWLEGTNVCSQNKKEEASQHIASSPERTSTRISHYYSEKLLSMM